ncbi:hypothetical protein [Paenibacillus sp. NPDC057967]|uniref:hypothetical protein n=1 Tax=Paenibacillus sp. NPDC057967 TaxID=3346293 RepID=UPI0036DADA8E
MIRSKIIICSLVALSLIGASAIAHRQLKAERESYAMRVPLPEESYRIYQDEGMYGDSAIYTPYYPREYIRIVKRTPRQ